MHRLSHARQRPRILQPLAIVCLPREHAAGLARGAAAGCISASLSGIERPLEQGAITHSSSSSSSAAVTHTAIRCRSSLAEAPAWQFGLKLCSSVACSSLLILRFADWINRPRYRTPATQADPRVASIRVTTLGIKTSRFAASALPQGR
jgi:hypothetical protein